MILPSPSFQRRFILVWLIPATLLSAIAFAISSPRAWGQTTDFPTPQDNRALAIKADVQEADAKTNVYTARGNVRINYPARQVQATAAQAQYFQREGRIVLNGDVYVLQRGNSIRGDSITYLINEGRFVATPKTNSQVESIYIVNDPNPQAQPQAAPQTPPFQPKTPQPPARLPAAPRQ